MNQGELSGLLKHKSFGEKKARSIEAKAGMPERYLNQADATTVRAMEQAPKPYLWPFTTVTPDQYNNLLNPQERENIENIAISLITAHLNAEKQDTPAHNAAPKSASI